MSIADWSSLGALLLGVLVALLSPVLVPALIAFRNGHPSSRRGAYVATSTLLTCGACAILVVVVAVSVEIVTRVSDPWIPNPEGMAARLVIHYVDGVRKYFHIVTCFFVPLMSLVVSRYLWRRWDGISRFI